MEHSYLYIALAALLVIAGLACVVLYYRRRLYHCQQALVRCINENLDMKEKLPPCEHPHIFTSQEITPKEFTKIICNMLKRLMYVSVFSLFAIPPTMAQEGTDTTYVFRFVTGTDGFYVPFKGNETELERLERCVASCRQRILDGDIPLYVDGHADGYAIAKTRSNRVKSELITRQGLKEGCFVTRNHADGEDYVTVTIRVAPSNHPHNGKAPNSPYTDVEKENTQVHICNKVENTEVDTVQIAVTEMQIKETTTQPVASAETAAVSDKEYTLSLRANLLRWVALTPDLGLEWRIAPSVGIAVNGSWTSWSWNDADRRYALWQAAPEVRWYLGEIKYGYIGAMYKVGQFNYKLSGTGKQGDLMGGGITGGYQLHLNRTLSLDFNVAVGCLHTDYEKYEVLNGVRVRRGMEGKNW